MGPVPTLHANMRSTTTMPSYQRRSVGRWVWQEMDLPIETEIQISQLHESYHAGVMPMPLAQNELYILPPYNNHPPYPTPTPSLQATALGNISYIPDILNPQGHFPAIEPFPELQENFLPSAAAPMKGSGGVEFEPHKMPETSLSPDLNLNEFVDLDMLSWSSLNSSVSSTESPPSDVEFTALEKDPVFSELIANILEYSNSQEQTPIFASDTSLDTPSSSNPHLLTPGPTNSPISLPEQQRTLSAPRRPKQTKSTKPNPSKPKDPCGPRRRRQILPNPEPVAYHCLKCTSRHGSQKELFRHEKQCRRPYKCQVSECQKQLSGKRELERHYAARHREYAKAHGFRIPEARCFCCGFTAVREDNVVRHMNRVHGAKVGVADVVR